jgi:DNA-binding transcriptional regulator YiaG
MTKPTTPTTDFARWRAELGLTKAAAARALGLQVGRVYDLEAGRRRDNGRPALPGRALRLAMAAVAHGLAPWAPPG